MKALKNTTPGACRANAAKLYGQVQEGLIFGAFDKQEQEAIWQEVLSASRDRLIPSLSSFFKDFNYLQQVSDCVKQLIEILPRKSVSFTLVNNLKEVN